MYGIPASPSARLRESCPWGITRQILGVVCVGQNPVISDVDLMDCPLSAKPCHVRSDLLKSPKSSIGRCLHGKGKCFGPRILMRYWRSVVPILP